MTEGRRDPAEPPLPPMRRLRRWLGLAPDPRLRRPHVPRLRPIHRAAIPASWQARAAVEAGVPLPDYLRARLARYETELPVPRARLPLQVELDGTDLRTTLVPWAPAGGSEIAAGAAALEALDGPTAVREWAQIHARIAELEEEAAVARRRAEEVADRLSADVVAGSVAGPPDEQLPPECLGRPVVRTPDALVACTAVALGAILAEAWAIAVPVLFLAGAYPPSLSGPHAVQAALLLAFSIGVAVGLLALAFAALSAVEALGRGGAPRGRRRWNVMAAIVALLSAAMVAAAAAQSAPRSGLPPAGHALLLLAIPVGAAFAVRRGQREHEARALERAAALAWDRERAAALGVRARRLEELGWAESAAEAARHRVAHARRRSRELAHRADAAARLLEGAARRERREQLRLGQSLLAALERDRYEYLRHAAARRTGEARAAPARAAAADARPAAPDRSPASGRLAG